MKSIRRAILAPLIPLTGVALALTAAGIHEAARRDLLAAFDRSLLATARGVAAGVDVAVDGTPEFEPEDVGLPELDRPDSGFFFRVTDETGRTVAASAGAPHPSGPPPAASPSFGYALLGTRRFRTVSLRLRREPERDPEDVAAWMREHPGESLPEAEPSTFWVTVGRPLDPVTQALSRLRTRLLLGFGTLFAALVLVPSWIVSRALRPLETLSQKAEEIGPDDPAARLPEDGVAAEIRGLVAALNRALGRLAGAYERQRRFTSDAAHELRTPLGAMRTLCEVALRRPREPEEYRETLQRLLGRIQKMGELVEHLLLLSRIQNGSGGEHFRPVDLAVVARNAAEAHIPAAEASGVRLEVMVSEPVEAIGNALLLEECVSNLVENAIRHTLPGGRVAVEARPGPPPSIGVADTGEGIPPEHLPHIFERFYRADSARSRRHGGAGLGLAIAREIARLHGGEIRVESQPGRGSRFELRLPPRASRLGHA